MSWYGNNDVKDVIRALESELRDQERAFDRAMDVYEREMENPNSSEWRHWENTVYTLKDQISRLKSDIRDLERQL